MKCVAPWLIGVILFVQSPVAAAEAEFSAAYTKLTKNILLKGIEVERFSLNYRKETGRQPTLKKLIFMGSQEAGAAGTLAFEVCALEQFERARRHPLQLNIKSLRHALNTVETTSIIAASGAGCALAYNMVKCIRNHQRGFDAGSAKRYVTSHLKEIDALVGEREALVEANKSHPAHERAVLEGKILKALRAQLANEYANFNADMRSASSTQNLFFAQNIAYNTLAAVGARLGYRALKEPKLNGPSNIIFIISGAMAGAAPLICSANLFLQKRLIQRHQKEILNVDTASLIEIASLLDTLKASDNAPTGTLIPSLPATQRMAMYADANHRFIAQLDNETTTMRRFNKVALQSAIAGPAIGGLLMTQGILGARGYYDYFPRNIKKQLDLSYRGAVCGTVAAGALVAGNAAFMLASLSYELRLKKKHQLPEQIIDERLTHLDEVEKIVQAL